MSSVVAVSLADAFPLWDSFPVRWEGGGTVVVPRAAPLVVSAVAAVFCALVVLLNAAIWLVQWLSELAVETWWSAWLTTEQWLVAGPSENKLLLLLFCCVVTVEAVDLSVEAGGFAVHESWLKSGLLWTSMGTAVTWLNPTGSLATWLFGDSCVTSSPIANCQLLEQRTIGMLQGETKS